LRLGDGARIRSHGSRLTAHGSKSLSLYIDRKRKKINFASNGRNRCNRVTVFSFYI
jgi:hypothetical protein